MAQKGSTLGSTQFSTKEELAAEIERLNTVITELKDQAQQQAAIAQTGKMGWMISTPNPSYNGTTAGVWFENGHAFIPADLKDAKKKVGILTNDFGYSVTETSDGQEVKAPVKKAQSILQAASTPGMLK
jgi:hypothetical protein